MRRSPRSLFWLWAAIILSVIALGFGLLRALEMSGASSGGNSTITDATPPTKESLGVIVNLPPGSGPDGSGDLTPLAGTPTLYATLIGPQTPADPWANAILDRATPLFEAGQNPGDGLAWWQGVSARSVLDYRDGRAVINSSPFAVAAMPRLTVAVPDPSKPNQLLRIGQIETDGSALTLTAFSANPSETDQSWILADNAIETPINALAIQAAARLKQFLVAFNETGEADSELALLGLQPIERTQPLTQIASAWPTPTDLNHPPSPTATRAPDASLGRLVAAKLDTAIDSLGAVLPQSVATHASQHAAPGPLTWTKAGPQVNGRPTGIGMAMELTIEYLAPNMPDGLVVPLMTASYDGNVTRLPDEQVYFQGQRMEEILYWMVYRSAERQGTLVISYDDFGARQSIGIVGFKPFSPPR